jgi:LPS sulfotransferase NodH
MQFVAESMEFDYENNDNFIRKIYFYPKYGTNTSQQWLVEKKPVKFECFDKIIRLYRENTLDQAISYLQTIDTQRFHHSDNKFDAYYELTKEFCDKYYPEIYRTIKMSNRNNEELKNLGVGLLLSYEEIFLENTGQKKIEEYIGFESKTNLYDPRHKLRVKNEEIDSYLETLLEDYRKNLKII